MRHQPIKCLIVLGALICVISIGAGCTQPSRTGLPGDSGSSVSATSFASPGSRGFLAPDTGVDKQLPLSLPSQSTSNDEWLLQPGLFGVQHGIWLGWISFAVGLFGIGLALFVVNRSDKMLSQGIYDLEQKLSGHKELLEIANLDIKRLSTESAKYSAEIDRLLKAYQLLENKQSAILVAINGLRVQQKPEPQSYAIPAPGLISTLPVSSQPCLPSPAQKQAELTAAVNRGDRQVVKAESLAQLNITHASENAISTGRLDKTQLEEVSAGGSYWAASFAGETWLYPTEQTLKGYCQSQRPTGIFQYNRQPIPSAQVVSPARLTLSGGLWQVVEMGSIAVPG